MLLVHHPHLFTVSTKLFHYILCSSILFQFSCILCRLSKQGCPRGGGGGGGLGNFALGPSLKGPPIKGPLNTCLKDIDTLIEQSDIDTLIEQSQYSSEEQCSKLINKEI